MAWLSPLLSDLQSIPLTTYLVIAVGVLVLATRMVRGSTLSTPHETPGKTLAVRQPGWIARQRARRGIRHPCGRVGLGYTSAMRAVHLDVLALNHHGYIGGAPGSGKTSLLRLLIQGYPGPVIALDTKGGPELADTVWGLPGHVWQIGGPLTLELLDPEPAILAQQLLEGEIFTDRAIVYRAIAEHAVQRAGWVLRWRDKPREPRRSLELLASPATLAAAIRHNAGVHSVSCLVFDCDRVPPDPERLAGVCWIGHTTWSHTPDKPRWRVVIPLARPVAAKRWRDVWQRARAALCPEADPSCKDPSRRYYLPSHARDAASESTVRAGPLLDPATLPELPPVPRPPNMRRVRVSADRRRAQGLPGRGD